MPHETIPYLSLTHLQQEEMLWLVRATIQYYLENKQTMPYATAVSELNQRSGAFVTLWRASLPPSAPVGERLRGCVGRVHDNCALYQTLQAMAISAATRDPRFPPIMLPELATLSIEISLLSPLQLVTDLADIKIGVHGLLLEVHGRSGLLLPQVASTRGWDVDHFLRALYWKAGLQPAGWSDDATLYAFTTFTFAEAHSATNERDAGKNARRAGIRQSAPH